MSWWLDESALPDRQLWARLTIGLDGRAEVLDLDQRIHAFPDAGAAQAWLRADEYARLADLQEDGDVSRDVLPPGW